MATVGLSTFSITRLNGSVTPRRQQAFALLRSARRTWRRGRVNARPASWRDGIDQLADGLDLGLLVHADDDVELVLDRGDEIHHRQAVPFEILGEARASADLDALLVERLDQVADLGFRFRRGRSWRRPYSGGPPFATQWGAKAAAGRWKPAAPIISEDSTSARGASISIVDGKVKYDARALDWLADGQTATDYFTYAIRLSNGTLSWATVKITLTGSNDLPTIVSATATGDVTEKAEPAEGGTLSDTGTITFADVDLTDTHSATVSAAVKDENGNTVASPLGALDARHGRPDREQLSAGPSASTTAPSISWPRATIGDVAAGNGDY